MGQHRPGDLPAFGDPAGGHDGEEPGVKEIFPFPAGGPQRQDDQQIGIGIRGGAIGQGAEAGEPFGIDRGIGEIRTAPRRFGIVRGPWQDHAADRGEPFSEKLRQGAPEGHRRGGIHVRHIALPSLSAVRRGQARDGGGDLEAEIDLDAGGEIELHVPLELAHEGGVEGHAPGFFLSGDGVDRGDPARRSDQLVEGHVHQHPGGVGFEHAHGGGLRQAEGRQLPGRGFPFSDGRGVPGGGEGHEVPVPVPDRREIEAGVGGHGQSRGNDGGLEARRHPRFPDPEGSGEGIRQGGGLRVLPGVFGFGNGAQEGGGEGVEFDVLPGEAAGGVPGHGALEIDGVPVLFDPGETAEPVVAGQGRGSSGEDPDGVDAEGGVGGHPVEAQSVGPDGGKRFRGENGQAVRKAHGAGPHPFVAVFVVQAEAEGARSRSLGLHGEEEGDAGGHGESGGVEGAGEEEFSRGITARASAGRRESPGFRGAEVQGGLPFRFR